MTIFTIDANGRRSKELVFGSQSELCAFLYDNSVFMSNWSILRDDLTQVYRASSDGSFRLFMVWDNNSRQIYNVYDDAAHWEEGLSWIA